jgi:hypothetical protein
MLAMWRYASTAILGLGLLGVGVAYFMRGQRGIGIAFVGIAVLRTAAVVVGRKPRKPEPSIRLNLEANDEVNQKGDQKRR